MESPSTTFVSKRFLEVSITCCSPDPLRAADSVSVASTVKFGQFPDRRKVDFPFLCTSLRGNHGKVDLCSSEGMLNIKFYSSWEWLE